MSHKGLVLALGVVLGISDAARADCPLPNPADCIYVDDDSCPTGTGTSADPFCSITEAYLAATPGATILVRAGTYNECVFASGFISPGNPSNLDKPVALIADEWEKNPLAPADAGFDALAALTTITGAGICDGVFPNPNIPAVFIGGNQLGGASIRGFRVTAGGDSGIAGRGRVAITNNLITGNLSLLGGGVYWYSGSCTYGAVEATIASNRVTGNVADDFVNNGSGSGGGIYVWSRGSEPDAPNNCVGGSSEVTVTNNEVTGNQASNTITDPLQFDVVSLGGGIYAQTDTPFPATVPAAASAARVAITQNLVSNNEILAGSAGYGAGIWGNTFGYGQETIEIRDNTVGPDNLAPLNGGGIAAWVTPVVASDHTMIVDGNTVTGNRASFGGGLDLLAFVQNLGIGQRFSLTASDNAVTGNEAFLDGGALFVEFTSQRSATVADNTTNLTEADEMTVLIRRNTMTGNTAGLGGGGAIVYATADADPEGQSLCLPSLQAAAVARVQFQDNLIAGNTATNVDPVASGDIIGAGILNLPAAFGEALAVVGVTSSTIAGNQIGPNGGFVGGIELAGFTDFDCDATHTGAVQLQVDRSIVAQNEEKGIGGPTPDSGQSVTVVRSSSFGNATGNYESTLFPGGTTPANNFASSVDPLLDAVTRVPDSCSPMYNVGQCVTPAGQTCFSSSSLASSPAPPACGAGGCVFSGAGHIENPDVNEDNVIDGIDLVRLAVAFGALANESPTPPDARYDAGTDFDRSGLVDGDDLDLLSPDFGRVCQP